jgi:phosphoribosylaminoimidazole (AIR) synthetase
MPKDFYTREIVDPNDRASQLGRDVCTRSYKNSPAAIIIPHQPGNFRGPVSFLWTQKVLQEMLEGIQLEGVELVNWRVAQSVENDGAGGKPQFFTLIGDRIVFTGLGWEIICMTAEDLSRSGRFPVMIDNVLDVKTVTEENFHLVQALFDGFEEALHIAGLINITGETAIMQNSVTAFCDVHSPKQLIVNWSASCIGLCRRDRLIDGSGIKPGMPIVGFGEDGYRCNGGTLHTKLILAHWGPKIEKVLGDKGALDFVRKLTVHSVYYGKTIARANGWNPDGSAQDPIINMAGIAHITGGGVWKKFGEMLPDGIGAKLDKMPKPPDVLLEAQEISWSHEGLELLDLRAYGTFHGGCGMMIVCATERDAELLIDEAAKDGIRAQRIGETTESLKGEIIIHSQFKEGRILSSNEL